MTKVKPLDYCPFLTLAFSWSSGLRQEKKFLCCSPSLKKLMQCFFFQRYMLNPAPLSTVDRFLKPFLSRLLEQQSSQALLFIYSFRAKLKAHWGVWVGGLAFVFRLGFVWGGYCFSSIFSPVSFIFLSFLCRHNLSQNTTSQISNCRDFVPFWGWKNITEKTVMSNTA